MKNENGKTDISPKTKEFIEKYGIVLYIWFLLVAVRWFLNSKALLRGEVIGNDDHMRMVQIRDWLGGQSWFDLHQYRLNPAEPLLSHWSRLSDVLVGVPIWILTPLFGQKTAELITVIVYPSALLLIFLYLIISLTKVLSESKAVPLAAAFMAALSSATISQFELGRIDHHGLQIAMAVVCCWFIIKSETQARFAIFAGLMAGVGLYVGIESAAYIAAACIAIVLVWVFAETDSEKRLRYFGLSMAASTLICLMISAPPGRWLAPSCDAISVVYTNLTLMVALVMWILSYGGKYLKSGISRFLAAAALGLATIGATVALYPQCFAGPYSEVDPKLVQFWLINVAEAKPFLMYFRGIPVGGMAIIILPVFAIIGYLLFHKKTRQGLSLAPRTIMIFTLIALFAGMIQIRLMGYAASFAIPFAAYLLILAFDWAEKFPTTLQRTAVRLGSVILLAPITIPLLLGLIIPQIDMPDPNKNDAPNCLEQPVLSNLNQLPPGLALTQIDMGAPILYYTDRLQVTSAPYHRNTGGNLAAINMFYFDEATAKEAVEKSGADYVIGCPDSNETRMIIEQESAGMLAQLSSGYVPEWLEKLDVEGTGSLLIYKVKLTD